MAKKQKIRVLIEVDGGVVQRIVSDNPDVTVCVKDWDNIRHDPDEALKYVKGGFYSPDTLTPNEMNEERLRDVNYTDDDEAENP